MPGLSDVEDKRLRAEIEKRISHFANRGLKIDRMRRIFDERGPIRLLEEYSIADPGAVSGWKALVADEPEMTLEWLAVNDPAAARVISADARAAAKWKLSKPV